MQFKDAIRSGWQRIIDFKGRSSRSEYWWWTLFYFLVLLVASAIELPFKTKLLSNLAGLIFLVPSISIAVRRLHDIDKSGWWLAPGFIAMVIAFTLVATITYIFLGAVVMLITSVVYIIWYCKPGTPGPNQYGPDPLAGSPVDITA